MKRSLKRALSMALTLSLVLSLFCTTAVAAQTTPSYPYLSVGAASVTKPFEKNDTVRIPVSLAGLGTSSSQYLSGFSCSVTAMGDGYLTVTGVEFAPSVAGWSGGYNAKLDAVNKVYLAFAEHPEDCLHSDGLLFTVVCTVAKDVPAGTSTGIQIKDVSMSQTSEVFLNSTDGKTSGLDANAVTYPLDADGDPTGGVSVPEEPDFVMTVSADRSEVVLDETVTVKVTVTGGAFGGAEYDLTYDPALFQLVTKPSDATDNNGTIGHSFLQYEAPAGTVIGTYTFKALAQDAEATGSFTLGADSKVDTALSALTGNSQPCTTSAPAQVTIKLARTLTVSAQDVTVDYDGSASSVTATANLPGATIKYADADGNYTLDAAPTYTDIGTHVVKFCATLKGYETAYGQATVKIEQPKYVTETVEYVSGYELLLVYSDIDAPYYTYDGHAMLNVTASTYSLNGTSYKHVYAWVVKGEADTGKIAYTSAKPFAVAYSCDVNASNKVDLRDAVATMCVYNVDTNYMKADQMALILRADVDHNKTVDAFDYGRILADSSYNKQ